MYVIDIVLNAWDVERDALFYLTLTKNELLHKLVHS